MKFESGNLNRREFIKKGTMATIGAMVGSRLFSNFENQDNSNEQNEKPHIVERTSWDDKHDQIISQYKKKIGDQFFIDINGEKYKRTVDVLPYFKENSFEIEELKDVYQRIIIHHTETSTTSNSKADVSGIRDLQISKRGFNDIAYHFLITNDGKIFEGRPLDRVGSHAGVTKEQTEYKEKYFPDGVESIFPLKGEEYYKKLRSYIDIQKMDPDYGSLGIAILGSFDKLNHPGEKQIKSLTALLNWVKEEYDLPSSNIIYHKAVKEKVVEASGLHLESPVTFCPGKSFIDKDKLLSTLAKDTEASKSKKLLLTQTNL